MLVKPQSYQNHKVYQTCKTAFYSKLRSPIAANAKKGFRRPLFLLGWLGNYVPCFSCIWVSKFITGKILRTSNRCRIGKKLFLTNVFFWQILDSADVHSAFMDLKGWGDPAPTTALDAWPIEETQASFTVSTGQLALHCTFFNCCHPL